MILIIESGSTKAEWVAIENGEIACQALTDGINPFLQTYESMIQLVKEQLPGTFLGQKYEKIYFYGAGCVSDPIKDIVRKVLSHFFNSQIYIESDLVAVARGLLKHEPGIACILGTGSNSCFYDGEAIIKNVRSLGYILGDEGSGSALGRMFLADCLKGIAPDDIADKFFGRYNMGYEDFMESVYRKPFPNRFMAGFSEFLSGYTDDTYVYNLISENFVRFFDRCICQYEYEGRRIVFTGSIAYYYEKILRKVADRYNASVGCIEKSPMPGLIVYHK